jgi:hypothetical protein
VPVGVSLGFVQVHPIGGEAAHPARPAGQHPKLHPNSEGKFARLHALHRSGGCFATRAKSNLDAHRVYSRGVDRATGLVFDQTIALDDCYAQKDSPGHLRRVRFKEPDGGKPLVFLSNHFDLPALRSARYKTAGGKLSFSSNGSSNTCASSNSTTPRRTS